MLFASPVFSMNQHDVDGAKLDPRLILTPIASCIPFALDGHMAPPVATYLFTYPQPTETSLGNLMHFGR